MKKGACRDKGVKEASALSKEAGRKETRKLVLPFCFDFSFHVPFNRLLNVLSLPFFYCIIYDLLHKEASVSVDGRLRTAGPW